MAERSEEVWSDEGQKPTLDAKAAPSPAAIRHSTRETMSWIRALANDWEDERSHSDLAK